MTKMICFKSLMYLLVLICSPFNVYSQTVTCQQVLEEVLPLDSTSQFMNHLLDETYSRSFSRRIESVFFRMRHDGDMRLDHFDTKQLDQLAAFSIPLIPELSSRGLRLLMEMFRASAQQIKDNQYRLPQDFVEAWDSELGQRWYESSKGEVVSQSHIFADRALLLTIIARTYFSSSNPSEELIESLVMALSKEDEYGYIRLFNYTGREVMVILRFLSTQPDLIMSASFTVAVEKILEDDPAPVRSSVTGTDSQGSLVDDFTGPYDGSEAYPEMDARILDNRFDIDGYED